MVSSDSIISTSMFFSVGYSRAEIIFSSLLLLYHTQSFFGLGTARLQIKIHLTGSPETSNKIFYLRHRPSWKVRKNVFSALKSPSAYPTHAPAGMERVMAYDGYDCETEGEVNLIMPPGKKLDHNGIQVKFFGRIDMVSCLWAESW